jgi:hypothetical protein
MPAKKNPANAAKPKVPANPRMPLKVWLSFDTNRERLKQILTDDVFLTACGYLIERNRVTTTHLLQQPMPDNMIARRAATHAGFMDFFTELQGLVSNKSTPEQPLAAWEYLKPDPITT